MSDLQCPATILLIPCECLASGSHVSVVAGRRLAGLFVDATVAADAAAFAAISDAAQVSQCPIKVARPARDSAGLAELLDELADGYRGETVAVVTTAAVIQARLLFSEAPSEPVAIAIDSDGWVVAAPRAG